MDYGIENTKMLIFAESKYLLKNLKRIKTGKKKTLYSVPREKSKYYLQQIRFFCVGLFLEIIGLLIWNGENTYNV